MLVPQHWMLPSHQMAQNEDWLALIATNPVRVGHPPPCVVSIVPVVVDAQQMMPPSVLSAAHDSLLPTTDT